METVPIVGYSDKLSGRPGDQINFMVSSEHKGDFTAQLFRSVSADPNPKGQGIVEYACDDFYPKQTFSSRKQKFDPGSYGITEQTLEMSADDNVRFSVTIYPTLKTSSHQTLIEFGRFCLTLDPEGHPSLSFSSETVTAVDAISIRRWQRIEAQINKTGLISIELINLDNSKSSKLAVVQVDLEQDLNEQACVIIAAQRSEGSTKNCFNGKIEGPEIYADEQSIALWDFSKNTSSLSVPGIGCPDLVLINAPTRAVTGALWDASEMNWQHKPEHYAAIAFHEDDIYDFNWGSDFSFVIPPKMPSGIYIMRISCEDDYDAIPFFVCPEKYV